MGKGPSGPGKVPAHGKDRHCEELELRDGGWRPHHAEGGPCDPAPGGPSPAVLSTKSGGCDWTTLLTSVAF